MGASESQRSNVTRLGSYEILRMLARGGMAEIYLARAVGPQGFEKLVVLKKILPQLAENPRFVRLFLDEAKLVAALDHSNIAHVYDMGMADGNYFFTMEYVHGQDVRSLLRRAAVAQEPMPLEHAVFIARNVASGLHYAHERKSADGVLLGIVHRDTSPSNILISYDGEVKLVDFGVAKAATSTTKTRTGTLKGKVSYMSPEQARGAALDRRSDVYSLGIVLWEMVTGRRLYKGDNDLQTIYQILHEEPLPPSELRPDCPAQLEQIVLRALAVSPDDRYPTAQQLQFDLEEFSREHKLTQSSIGLSTYVHSSFSDEIKAWREAQSSGVTLTDHVLGLGETTTDEDSTGSDIDVAHPDDDVDGDDEGPLHDPDVPVRSSALLRTQRAVPRPSAQRAAVAAEPGSLVVPRSSRTPWIVGGGLLIAGLVAAFVVWNRAGEESSGAGAADRGVAPAPASATETTPSPTPAATQPAPTPEPTAEPAPPLVIPPPAPVAVEPEVTPVAADPPSVRDTKAAKLTHKTERSHHGRDRSRSHRTTEPSTDKTDKTDKIDKTDKTPDPKFDPNPFPPS